MHSTAGNQYFQQRPRSPPAPQWHLRHDQAAMTSCAFVPSYGVGLGRPRTPGVLSRSRTGLLSHTFRALRRTRIAPVLCLTPPDHTSERPSPTPPLIPEQTTEDGRRDTSADTSADTNQNGTIPTDSNDSITAPLSSGFRILLTTLSLSGAVETLYLTYNKVFSSPGAICATEGCLDVLSGPFSIFLGFPLSLYGSLAYLAFSYLSIWPLLPPNGSERETDPQEIYLRRDSATRPLMVCVSTMQFSFSMYLIGLLKFVIKSMCPYCTFSAVLSATMFVLTVFVGRAVRRWQSAFPLTAASTTFAAIVAAASFITGYPAYSSAQLPAGVGPQAPPAITAQSDQDSLRVAKKLAKKNTTMYGAFWCTHCYDQKQRFGAKAFSMLRYVECDKNGVNSQSQLCRDKRIPGYPTWEIDGEMYPGEIELSELERLVDEASKP